MLSPTLKTIKASELNSYIAEKLDSAPLTVHKPIVTVEMLITPETAREFLKFNHENRPIKAARVKLYSRQMSDGKWSRHGQGIQFDTEGFLIDGQNRLLAVIKSGESIWMSVSRNVPRASRTDIDTGALRSGGDAIAMVGGKNTEAAAAIIRLYLGWQVGEYQTSLAVGKQTSEISEFYTANEDRVQKAVTVGRACKGLASAGVMGGMYLVLCDYNKVAADEFFWLLSTGEDLHNRHPCLALRNSLMRERVVGKGNPARSAIRDTVAKICRTWNKFRSNQLVAGPTSPVRGLGENYTFPTPSC